MLEYMVWINSHFPSATGCKVSRAIIVTEGFHTHPHTTQARLAKSYQAKFLQIKAYRRECFVTPCVRRRVYYAN